MAAGQSMPLEGTAAPASGTALPLPLEGYKVLGISRVLAETTVTQRFNDHDLRAKAGSDAESLERARQLLGHADTAITQRVYRRKPERIG